MPPLQFQRHPIPRTDKRMTDTTAENTLRADERRIIAAAPVGTPPPAVDPTHAAVLADAAQARIGAVQSLGVALDEARSLVDRLRIELAEALREVEVTNAAGRILAAERDRADRRVAELEEQLQRLRSVPEIGGARVTTVVIDGAPGLSPSVSDAVSRAAAAKARRQRGGPR